MKRFLFILPYLLMAFAIIIIVVYLNNEATRLEYAPREFYYGQ